MTTADAARWLRGRTNRVFNVGLLAAGAIVVLSIGWLALAFAGARSDLLSAQAGVLEHNVSAEAGTA